MYSSVRGDGRCPPLLDGWLRNVMGLHEAAPNVQPVLQLPARRIEGVVNGNVNILVRLLIVGHSADGDFVAPGPDVDDDAKEPPFALVLVRRLDRNPATHDVVSKLLEFLRLLAHGSFDEVGLLQVLESDL